MTQDIIYALSSGHLPSGVAVIRISGSGCLEACQALIGSISLKERKASLRVIRDPASNEIIDEGLIIAFNGPNSFTGEDCLEFQIHGGVAVVEKLMVCLSSLNGFRLAEAGEFSRRAFENGRLDLTEVEGLSDLISSQTEQQHKLAIAQAGGAFRDVLESWRSKIVKCWAFIEADFDFGEEDDVPGAVAEPVWKELKQLRDEISSNVEKANSGEIIRSGFKVALMGKPNAGKSSLLNALAKRDIAIVSDEAGTTRDVLEANLNINGYQVIVYDTAGVRETDSNVEKEGIKRALNVAREADLIFWLQDATDIITPEERPSNSVLVLTKSDKLNKIAPEDQLTCSVLTESGTTKLVEFVSSQLESSVGPTEDILITRERHRIHLNEVVRLLTNAIDATNGDTTLRSEDLRLAGVAIGKITGKIDVEDLLDVIFSEFCIGK